MFNSGLFKKVLIRNIFCNIFGFFSFVLLWVAVVGGGVGRGAVRECNLLSIFLFVQLLFFLSVHTPSPFHAIQTKVIHIQLE